MACITPENSRKWSQKVERVLFTLLATGNLWELICAKLCAGCWVLEMVLRPVFAIKGLMV